MIGRKSEQGELARMYESDESEFVAIYGRRRVGKTYLVRETFDGQFTFQHSGLAKGGMKRQLASFAVSLKSFGLSGHGTPKNWDEAFVMLREVIDASEFRRKVVFIDEMPWLDTPRSNFVSALEGFWNGWASARKDILLIVCGSAASWIAKKLFRNRGGLHNRVTCRICLNPFTLNECESLVRERGLVMSRSEMAECYMAFGGIPYYWRYLDKRFSVVVLHYALLVSFIVPLADEFVELYSSLFRNSAMPRKIVKELAGRLVGMTRKDIAHALGISASGKLTDALEALTVSGFVRKYNPFLMHFLSSISATLRAEGRRTATSGCGRWIRLPTGFGAGWPLRGFVSCISRRYARRLGLSAFSQSVARGIIGQTTCVQTARR